MTLEEIKAAVLAGHIVCWSNEGYEVIQDQIGQWLIVFLPNRHCIGLTWRDGHTLNGREDQFFVKHRPSSGHGAA